MTIKTVARKTRRSLKKFCAVIYQIYFAQLSDEEMLRKLDDQKALLEANRGKEVQFRFEYPDGQGTFTQTVTVTGKPENN